MDGPIRKAVWTIAWPTMLQNVIGGLQGLVDHAMVGHYVGYTGNAAIGVSWQIFLVVVVFISSLFTGMGVLVARFTGANDREKVNRTVYQAFLTAAALSIGVMAPIGYILAPSLLGLINAAPEVQVEALPYLRIMFLFSFGILVFFMTGGAFRSAGDARTPLRLGIILTGLNIILERHPHSRPRTDSGLRYRRGGDGNGHFRGCGFPDRPLDPPFRMGRRGLPPRGAVEA